MSLLTNIISKMKNGNLIPYFIYTSYLLYAITYLGIFFIGSYYVNGLKLITQTYIALTLIFYFNPFSSFKEITPNMRRLIFSSGFILLLNNIPTIQQMMKNTIITMDNKINKEK